MKETKSKYIENLFMYTNCNNSIHSDISLKLQRIIF